MHSLISSFCAKLYVGQQPTLLQLPETLSGVGNGQFPSQFPSRPAFYLLPSRLRPHPLLQPTTSVWLVAWETSISGRAAAGAAEMAEKRHPTVSTDYVLCPCGPPGNTGWGRALGDRRSLTARQTVGRPWFFAAAPGLVGSRASDSRWAGDMGQPGEVVCLKQG